MENLLAEDQLKEGGLAGEEQGVTEEVSQKSMVSLEELIRRLPKTCFGVRSNNTGGDEVTWLSMNFVTSMLVLSLSIYVMTQAVSQSVLRAGDT